MWLVGWLFVGSSLFVVRSFDGFFHFVGRRGKERGHHHTEVTNEPTTSERTNRVGGAVCVKHDMVTVACVRARVRACVRACVYVRACAAPAMVDLNTSLPVKATNTTRKQRADLGVMQPTRLLAARLFGSRYFVRPSHPVHDGSLTHSLAFACSVD